VVESIEGFRQSWGPILGLDEWVVREAELPAHEVQLHGGVLNHRIITRVACTRFAGTALELLEPVSGASATQDWLEQNGEGLQHVAVWVRDLPSALDRLEGRIDVTYSPANLRPELASRPVAAVAGASAIGDDSGFWCYAQPLSAGSLWSLELLDTKFAEDFRAYYGNSVYYPGELP
jgi:hypothetical protein